MYGRQTAPGVPGSFPLPNPAEMGNAYKANALHPSAAAGRGALLGPRANPINGGRPALAGRK
jgi:hypothetical protein